MLTAARIKKFSIIQLCFLLYFTGDLPTLQAQIQQKFPDINIQYHYGFLLNHSPMRSGKSAIGLTDVHGIETTLLWPTNGQRYWHRKYGYPKWGTSFIFFNVGSSEIFNRPVHWGNVYSWLIHSSLRVVQTSFFEFNIRLGTGVGYFSQVYHPVNNPDNLWISARLNSSMYGHFETVYKILPTWHVVIAGAYTHFSNGATRMPNLGVNFPTVNIGLRYHTYGKTYVQRLDTIHAPLNRHYLHVSLGVGAKVLGDFGTTYYRTLAASVQYGYFVGQFSKLLLSLDAFRDNSLLDSTNRANNTDINRLGIWAGHEFMHGRVGVVFGWGYYFYKKTERDANNYIKVGLRYHFHKNLFGAIILKTHYGQADCFEWTLGYTFPRYY